MFAKIHQIHRIIFGAICLAIVAFASHSLRSPQQNKLAPLPEKNSTGILLKSERLLMGSHFKISVWEETSQEQTALDAMDETFKMIKEMEDQISSWRDESLTSLINKSAGKRTVTIDHDFKKLLTISLDWAKKTDGAFDITGGPLFELWQQAHAEKTLPDINIIKQKQRLVGFHNVQIEKHTVMLNKHGMKIGFGAIGKGYAADRGAKMLREKGLNNFIIDAGGDLLVSGMRGIKHWNVALKNPHSSEFLGYVMHKNYAIATSGDYERYFTIDGKQYSHIIDLQTGWPSQHITSVTVISRHAADADALATALTVMSIEKGLELIESLEFVEVLLVENNGTVHLSSGLRLENEYLEITRWS